MTASPKKKVQPRESASKRRRDANVELGNLAELLPLPVAVASRLDKTSIVRLTISYWKLRELFPNGLGRDWGEELVRDSIWENSGLAESGKFLNKALHGFVFVLGADGKILYISEEASAQLGYSQVHLTGQNFWNYVHTCDAEEVKANLCFNMDIPARKVGNNSPNEIEVARSFTVRMKCILPKRQAELAVDGYKVIHCEGYIKLKRKYQKRECPSDLTYAPAGLVAVGYSLSQTPNAELKLNSLEFIFRTELSLKIIYMEPGSQKITGYEPLQLKDKSFYRLVHPYDCKQIEEVHVLTIKKSQAITRYYRFLTGSGGWIWLQSSCIVITSNKADTDHCILFINTVLSEPNQKKQGFIMEQLHPPKTNKGSAKKSRVATKNMKKSPYCAQKAAPPTKADIWNDFLRGWEAPIIYPQPTNYTDGIPNSLTYSRPGSAQCVSQSNWCGGYVFDSSPSPLHIGEVNLPQNDRFTSHNNYLCNNTFTTSPYVDRFTKDFSIRPKHALPMQQPSDTAYFHVPQDKFHLSKFVAHPENSSHIQTSRSSSVSPTTHGGCGYKNEQMLPFLRRNSFNEAKFRQLTHPYSPILAEEDKDDEFRKSRLSSSFDDSNNTLKEIVSERHGAASDSNDSYMRNLVKELIPINSPKLDNVLTLSPTTYFVSEESDHQSAQKFAPCNVSKYPVKSALNNTYASATCSSGQDALDSLPAAENSFKNNEIRNTPGRSLGITANEGAEAPRDSLNCSFTENSSRCGTLKNPEFNGRTLSEGSSVNESIFFRINENVHIPRSEQDLLIDQLFSFPRDQADKMWDSISINETSYTDPKSENIQNLNISTTTRSHKKMRTTKLPEMTEKVNSAFTNVTNTDTDTPFYLSNSSAKSKMKQQTDDKSSISSIDLKNKYGASYCTSASNNTSTSSNTSKNAGTSEASYFTIFDLELEDSTIAPPDATNSKVPNLSFSPSADVSSSGIGYLPLDRRISAEASTSNIPGIDEDFLAPFRGSTALNRPDQIKKDRTTSPSSASLGYVSGSSYLSSSNAFSDWGESTSFSNQSHKEVQSSGLCDSSQSF